MAAFPLFGAILSLLPLHHLDYVASTCGAPGSAFVRPSPGGNSDLYIDLRPTSWALVAALNNNSAPGSCSVQSVASGSYLSPLNGSASVGVATSAAADADDLSWTLVPGVENSTLWSLVTQSKVPALSGALLTVNASQRSVCIEPGDAASADLALARPGAAGALSQTFATAPPVPALTLPGPPEPAAQPAWLAAWTAWREGWRAGSGFNPSVYNSAALSFGPALHAAPLVPVYDRLLSDAATSAWTVDRFLDDLEARWGGVDGVWLWGTYPNLGIDERNQFQVMFEDLPGGLLGLKAAVDTFHARGVRVGIGYNPWDIGTSPSNATDAALLATLGAEVNLDFANMDCMGLPAVPRSFYNDSVAAGRPLAFMPEMGPTFLALQWTTLTNGYWPAPGPVPDVDALKWLERRFQSLLWMEPGTVYPDFQTIFFNGAGFGAPESLWGTSYAFSDYVAESCRRVLALLRFLGEGAFLVSEGWEPHAPLAPEAAAAGVFSSRWPVAAGVAFAGGPATAWTVVNKNAANFSGPLLLLPCPAGPPSTVFFDLYAGAALTPVPYASGGCALSVPLVEARGYGAVLAAPAAGAKGNATLAAFLARMAAMTARPLATYSSAAPPANQSFTPRPATLLAPTAPAGMVAVPAADKWTFAVSAVFEGYDGADAVQYPWEAAPSRVHSPIDLPAPGFFIDTTPVTNAAYATFLATSGYTPADPHNFLRDWNGSMTPPAGWEARPVTWVDLRDAGAFCAHAGKRLPQDWEWQRAMQGTDNRTYPWGDAFAPSCVPPQQTDRVRAPPPNVGGFPRCASPSGALDGMGLVWQWTSELSSSHTRAGLVRGGAYWAAQGSDWYFFNNLASGNYLTTGPLTLKTYARLLLMAPSYDRHGTVGFRCVVDAA
jgi:iron(II)-dependent oxidoreductase